jgi:hypothetical protein
MSRLLRWLAARIIARAMLTPYRKGHIIHADGTLYMGRWSLFETRWLSARVHHIATADHDRHLHDHPWNFISVVLGGRYIERRPREVEPCFTQDDDSELGLLTVRHAGSLAFRRATDRHAITYVSDGVWTLFIYGATVQWWGFYTKAGKIHWRDYATCHTAGGNPIVPTE